MLLSGCAQQGQAKQNQEKPQARPPQPAPKEEQPKVPEPKNKAPYAPPSPADICIAECKYALSQGRDLSAGPCLLNPIAEYPEWVCDVAHSPREAVDNNPANQCPAFGKAASHFVEVAPDCSFIRER